MIYGLVILCGIIGAFLSRWHGGGFFKSPKVLKNLFWAIPFALVSILAFHGSPLWVQITVAVISLALSIAGKAMGHGRGFRLHEPMKLGSEPEVIEAIIPDKLPLYWYKVAIMSLTGFCAVSGAVLPVLAVNPKAAVIIALGGLFKGVNAMVFDKHTELRELADGYMAYVSLAVGVIIIGQA